MTNDWIDLKNSDCFLVIGGNPAENHPVSFRWINEARAHGARLVVVDPRFNRTAATADDYAALRSGTDIVFLGAMINYAIQNKLYNEVYVTHYTNALQLINPDYQGPADLDGLFSGYDPEKNAYDTSTWQYQTERKTVPGPEGEDVEVLVNKLAGSLDDPHCVFQYLKRHYARYTPAMVEQICGTPQADFLRVAEAFCATGAADRSGTILYAMGQTQHSVGSQNVRIMAVLQLLLGNIGMPGGGVNALRGESNVQGSTDMALLYHDLPGYLGAPTDRMPDLAAHAAKYDKTSYWSNGPRFMQAMLKAWYGEAATNDNEFAYSYLPKSSGNYSWIPLFEAMYQDKIDGLICMGQNPAVSGPNARLERKALANLDWLVVMDLFETETASFWKAPGVDAATISTEVFMLPAVDALEKAGSVSNSGRRIQWRPQVAVAHGEAHSDLWILDRLAKHVKALYRGSTDDKDRPILDMVWDYGEEPDVEAVAREVNGYAIEPVVDASGQVLVERGELLPGFATIAAAANLEAIACGVWIYAGYFAPADDGTGQVLPAAKRRGQDDPGGMGIYPHWGFAWPANRHILYNRASCKPDGTPWAEHKRLIWWDAEKKAWTGYDVPDWPGTKAPDAPANPAAAGVAGLAGTDAFMMKADGKGWLYAPKGMAEGPLPEHYEPIESPVANAMSGCQNNPVVKVWDTDRDAEIGDRIGATDKFPIVATTYRLTEHWQTGTMSRTIPWLAELQPDLFVEMSKELASERGIQNGDKVIVSSARGQIRAVAMVTARFRPINLAGKTVHQVGLPWHYGWQGIAVGDVTNDITPHVGDGNSHIPEYKAFLVEVQKA